MKRGISSQYEQLCGGSQGKQNFNVDYWDVSLGLKYDTNIEPKINKINIYGAKSYYDTSIGLKINKMYV